MKGIERNNRASSEPLDTDTIRLAQGNGGILTKKLINDVFKNTANKELDLLHDAASVTFAGPFLSMTTDSFVVSPYTFPGGNVGALSIYGTVNDLAVVGAPPRYISTAFIIEEGFSMTALKEVVHKMHQAAVETNVSIITGDTKVVPKGFGGGVYINTTGVGDSQETPIWDTSLIRPGDHVLVSGSVGDHGACVLLAREDYGLHGQLKSDCASVFPLVNAIRDLEGVRFVRDPTRGGLSVLLHDVATETGFNIELIENNIPVRPEVASVCDILGFDPFVLACEGLVIAIVSLDISSEVLTHWRGIKNGENAQHIGVISKNTDLKGRVSIITPMGGRRFMSELEDEPLPRIC